MPLSAEQKQKIDSKSEGRENNLIEFTLKIILTVSSLCLQRLCFQSSAEATVIALNLIRCPGHFRTLSLIIIDYVRLYWSMCICAIGHFDQQPVFDAQFGNNYAGANNWHAFGNVTRSKEVKQPVFNWRVDISSISFVVKWVSTAPTSDWVFLFLQLNDREKQHPSEVCRCQTTILIDTSLADAPRFNYATRQPTRFFMCLIFNLSGTPETHFPPQWIFPFNFCINSFKQMDIFVLGIYHLAHFGAFTCVA